MRGWQVNFFSKHVPKKQPDRDDHHHQKILEKRKHPRYGICELTYLYPRGKAPVQVTLLDIGLGGIRMEAKEKLDLDSTMGLVLYDRGIVVKATIEMRWETKGKLTYLYGAEFVELDPRTKAHIRHFVNDMQQ